MIKRVKRFGRVKEEGSALVYILIAIALLAALTISFMNPSSNQTTSQNTFRTVSEIQSQIDFVRSAIQECVLTYPGGDSGVMAFTSSHNYPIMPDDAYLNACGANPEEPAGTHTVRTLRCPGNPGDNVCHTDMFGGLTGKFMPPAPSYFGEWQYYNGDDGVFMWIESTNTDAFLDTVLDKLDAGFSVCESDVMRPSGADFQMTSDMGVNVVCGDGNKCFRIWLKIATSAVYVGGSPEALAGC